VDDQNNHRVAIKQLKQSGPNFKKVVADEASVLEIMRELGEEHHLIKAIAYYRKGEDLHYFIFPWAELGNLWEFWTSRNKSPETDPDYMIWALTQLTGLASALEALHHMATDTDVNCRHGDLKPLNILCFKTEDGHNHNPRLVITDVGLARVHNEATRERGKTTTTAWTIRYAAPELVVDSKTTRSRRFDIWSFGCILLEFVVWNLLTIPRNRFTSFYLQHPAPRRETYQLETWKSRSRRRRLFRFIVEFNIGSPTSRSTIGAILKGQQFKSWLT
jgi:serine/threonine protein kinase